MRNSRRGAVAAAGVAACAVGLGLVGGMGASAVHFARRVLTPATRPDAEVMVWAYEPASEETQCPARVWIHGKDADLPGRYSFIFNGGSGHARLGPVVERIRDRGVDRVCREVVRVDRGALAPGVTGRVTGWWYTQPEELGFPTERVVIPVEDGDSWGWLITPHHPVPGRWAVHVHGRGALPEETLRGIAPFARAGVTSLVLAYRNDPGAPRGRRGRYGLGLAEHLDVDAAIGWAVRHGATRVTLAGWSMGGTTSLLSATRGRYRSHIDGLVLDTPGLDWRAILRRQARIAGAPRLTADVGIWLMQRGWVRGAVPQTRVTDIASLSPEAFARQLEVPVLIHAGPGDTFVPWGGSVRFAHLRPELVRLREAPGEHVKIWNVAPEEWETATEEFVAGLGDPPARHARLGQPAKHRKLGDDDPQH